MHEFKPGDLAIITTVVGPVQPGSVVTVGELWEKGTRIRNTDGDKFETTEDLYCFNHPSIQDGFFGHAPIRFFIPLRGDFAPERQKSQEVPA